MFDPTDSTGDIAAQVEARVQEETEKLADFSSESGKEKGLSHEFVMDCLASNELGDGLLFAQLHRGKFLYDAAAGQWYRWTGHYWEMDVECRSLAAVESVALAYVNATYCINKKISSTEDDAAAEVLKAQRKSLNRRIDRLRNIKGRFNCLNFSTTLPVGALNNGKNTLVITGNHLDQNAWLLACQNGVVDLRTGVLRPGRSDDFLTKPAPIPFPENIGSYLATGENSPAPNWGKVPPGDYGRRSGNGGLPPSTFRLLPDRLNQRTHFCGFCRGGPKRQINDGGHDPEDCRNPGRADSAGNASRSGQDTKLSRAESGCHVA